MLVGLAGLLAGYDGGFEFKSGEAYPDSVPYVAMRVMLATFGVGMVPLAWYTAVELGMSQWSCHLTALMVLLGDYFMFLASFLLSNSWAVQISAGSAYLDSSSWILCFCSSPFLLFSA
jgi:dolichyl-phosphate-mannose-protein mannosyltransferase